MLTIFPPCSAISFDACCAHSSRARALILSERSHWLEQTIIRRPLHDFSTLPVRSRTKISFHGVSSAEPCKNLSQGRHQLPVYALFFRRTGAFQDLAPGGQARRQLISLRPRVMSAFAKHV